MRRKLGKPLPYSSIKNIPLFRNLRIHQTFHDFLFCVVSSVDFFVFNLLFFYLQAFKSLEGRSGFILANPNLYSTPASACASREGSAEGHERDLFLFFLLSSLS